VVVREIFSHSIMQVHLWQNSQSKCREAQVELTQGKARNVSADRQ
jgi:hypothetical protein